jgi:hypothetical protein
MRTKKQIDVTNPKLNSLSIEAKALYFTLLLSSDDGGMVPFSNGNNPNHLLELINQELIIVTHSFVILIGYITVNYGDILKPEYNPHKPILKSIENSGFEYKRETNEINIPIIAQITDLSSLIKLCGGTSGTNSNKIVQTSPQVTKIAQSNIVQTITSINFALYLAIALMIGQSVHSSFTLMSLSHIPNPYNMVASIFTALLMDGLIIYFVASGKTKESFIFFLFCALMNLYSYHLQTDYFTYKSFFAVVVSIAIPYAVHAVANQINGKKIANEMQTKEL